MPRRTQLQGLDLPVGVMRRPKPSQWAQPSLASAIVSVLSQIISSSSCGRLQSPPRFFVMFLLYAGAEKRQCKSLPNAATERITATFITIYISHKYLTLLVFHENMYHCIACRYMVYFRTIQSRLVVEVNFRVRGGFLTERGLARSIGMSQPHIHNVLKGGKILTPLVADKILFHLNLSLEDLMREVSE